MLRLTAPTEVPEATVKVAKAAFPKGNVYLQIRDELGTLYQDKDFAELYPEMGRPAVPAWHLALVTVVQFKEGSERTPLKERFNSPYDPEAKHGNKGSKQWEGYKVHITEHCEEGLPFIVTHTMTTTADVVDFDATLEVHNALEAKGLLPDEHLVDSGYVKASHIW